MELLKNGPNTLIKLISMSYVEYKTIAPNPKEIKSHIQYLVCLTSLLNVVPSRIKQPNHLMCSGIHNGVRREGRFKAMWLVIFRLACKIVTGAKTLGQLHFEGVCSFDLLGEALGSWIATVIL